MDIYDNAEQLKQVPLFAGCDKAKLNLLAFTSEVITFREGEYLFRLNEPSDSVYVILKGTVDVLYDKDPNSVLKVATLGKNNMLGEMGVFLSAPRSASILALEQVQALKIQADRFIKLATETPQIALSVMKELSSKIAFTGDMALKSSAELQQLKHQFEP